jgi:hypothetical protein
MPTYEGTTVCVGITNLVNTIWVVIRTKREHNHPKTLILCAFLVLDFYP